jgi:hypothetical protein
MERRLVGAVRVAVVCLGFGLAGVAWAASPSMTRDRSVPEYANTVWLGGGTLGFVGRERPTDPQATAWTARYGYSPSTAVTWELAYQGATDVTPREVEDPSGVVATFVDFDMRTNIVPMTAIYPFFAGGVGYGLLQQYDRGTATTSDLATFSVPLAVGVEMLFDELSLESRLQYRPTWFDEGVHLTGAGADSWAWIVTAGRRF